MKTPGILQVIMLWTGSRMVMYGSSICPRSAKVHVRLLLVSRQVRWDNTDNQELFYCDIWAFFHTLRKRSKRVGSVGLTPPANFPCFWWKLIRVFDSKLARSWWFNDVRHDRVSYTNVNRFKRSVDLPTRFETKACECHYFPRSDGYFCLSKTVR